MDNRRIGRVERVGEDRHLDAPFRNARERAGAFLSQARNSRTRESGAGAVRPCLQ